MANYKKYVELYKKKQKRLQFYGFNMKDKMYSKKEFELMYKQVYNQKKMDIAEHKYTGKQKEMGNLYKEIVEEQAQSATFKQAKAARAANPQMDKSLRYFQYGEGFWETVDADYHQQKEEGYTSTEAKHYIAMTYFGSK